MSYIWPLVLIVVSNSIYHICAKSLPAKADPFAALTITYSSAPFSPPRCTFCSIAEARALYRNGRA